MKKRNYIYLFAALSLFSAQEALNEHVHAEETIVTPEIIETTLDLITKPTSEFTSEELSTSIESTSNEETTVTETSSNEVTTIEVISSQETTTPAKKLSAPQTVATPTSGYASSNIVLKDITGNTTLGELPKGKKINGVVDGDWIIVDYNGQKAKFLKSFMSQNPILFQGFATTNTNIQNAALNTGYNTLRNLNTGGFISGKYHDNGEFIEFSNYGKTAFVPVKSVLQLDQNVNGWINKGNYRYYVDNKDNKQEVARGWKIINGNTYYFDPMMRYMYTGVKSTGENVYFFENDGHLTSGYKVIPGTNHSNKITFGTPTQTELTSDISKRSETSFLGQAATNEALKGMGRQYYWYGTDISGTSPNNGLYCSGLAYQAYKNIGITIPGPEWGNVATAKTKGPQSGPSYRGWGPAGDYGYQMVIHQYLDTHTKTGGTRFKNTVSNLRTGDLVFARDPGRTHLAASHTAMYAGKVNGKPFIIHSGFSGTYLENYYNVTTAWGYPYMTYAQRPYAETTPTTNTPQPTNPTNPTNPTIGGGTANTYTVQKGDYLYKIAQQFGVTVQQLKDWNKLPNNYIYTGNKLIVSDPNKTNIPTPKPTPTPVPKPTPTPTPTPVPATNTYTVQKGDYLYKIAQQFGVTVQQLKDWNKLPNNYIYTGNKLIVSDPNKTNIPTPKPTPTPTPVPKPVPTPTPKPVPATNTYTVQKGDYLYKIAQQFGVTVQQLKDWNKLPNNYIYTGNKLIVSNPTTVTTPTPKPTPTPVPKPAPSTNNKTIHTVKSGEYLYLISQKYGVTVEQIKTWNNLTSNYIYSGDQLIVAK